MTPSRVIFHPEAAHDIEGARDWYRQQNPGAEEGFLLALDHAVEQVATAPHRWPRYKAKTRRYVFRLYPYTLIYRDYPGLVRILAVAHDSRRKSYWLTRTSGD